MSRPASVQIGLYRYAVAVDNTRLERENLYGQILYSEQQIVVRDDVTPERQAAILLHEVLHGVLEMAGLQQGKKLEEFVTVAAPGLVSVLRQNSDLARVILGPGFTITEVTP